VKRVLVTGAGGFIGHHLIKFLTARNYWVRGVDIKAMAGLPSGYTARRIRLQPRGQHGRDKLHRVP
jgi:nucleoside-diphosphate-sugar epimerase